MVIVMMIILTIITIVTIMKIDANLIDHPILKIVAEGENAHLVDHVKLSRSENKSAEISQL